MCKIDKEIKQIKKDYLIGEVLAMVYISAILTVLYWSITAVGINLSTITLTIGLLGLIIAFVVFERRKRSLIKSREHRKMQNEEKLRKRRIKESLRKLENVYT